MLEFEREPVAVDCLHSPYVFAEVDCFGKDDVLGIFCYDKAFKKASVVMAMDTVVKVQSLVIRRDQLSHEQH